MSPRRALLVLLGALACVVFAVPARDTGASVQAIGVSRDGERFGPELGDELFDPSVRWVPGDVREARFWVRNQADRPGDLSIDVVTPGRTGLLETGRLTVSARVGDGAWRVLEDGGPGRVVTASDVGSAQRVPVDVRVALAADSFHRTEGRATDLGVAIVRADARSQDPGLPWWAPSLGAPLLSLLLAGLLVLGLSFRDRPSSGEPS